MRESARRRFFPGFWAAYHRVVAVEPDAKPTIEALEAERLRLKELERNLASERDRIQEAAAREVARMQAALRDAAERAGKRERELESTQRKLERKGQGRRLAVFGASASRDLSDREQALARREAEVGEREQALEATAVELEQEEARLRELEASLAESREGLEHAEVLAARGAEIETRRVELDRQVAELVEVERRSADALAARAAELERRAAELDAREVELEERSQTLAEREQAAQQPEPEPEPEPEEEPTEVEEEEEEERPAAKSKPKLVQPLRLTRPKPKKPKTPVREEQPQGRQPVNPFMRQRTKPKSPSPKAGQKVATPPAEVPRAAAPKEKTPERPADNFVDLADWLREERGPRSYRMVAEEDHNRAEGEEADFTDMLEKFKAGVAANVDDEDFDSHYDLGVAYKEMGLIEEAIAEFQKALRGATQRIRAYEALGQCFIDRNDYESAITVLGRALREPGMEDEDLIGVLYLLGFASEGSKKARDAAAYYQRVFAIDIDFRDVSKRLKQMAKAASK